ncbi:MAG: RuBisCO large subunit C-terminal-like domain-containing protein [Bifidobacterium sp.]|uniref:RuBisCO large subunit C-terminal-like domain-containing protein n=1 Tax=Bifidobacterium fermentum TaxID=3059035 RepID=A0AB39UBB2_9BIFI
MSSEATIEVEYEIRGDVSEARQRAESLAVEQSHEFPREYAPAKADRSLGRVSEIEQVSDGLVRAVIAFPEELTAYEFPQFLVVLMGNASLLPGIRLADFRIGESFARAIGGGPKLGIEGIRKIVDVKRRPLLATALKPVGLDTEDIVKDAYDCAIGGVDIIKDDQGLGNQTWSRFAERVPLVSDAIRKANDETGRHSVYLPCFNPPVGHVQEHLDILLKNHVGGCLAVPGISGFDIIPYLRDNTPDDFIIYGHPALLGGWTASSDHGIREDLLFGHLLRLLGADSIIFPSYGGRFTFSQEQCHRIADREKDSFVGLKRSLPSPGGGMTLDRIPELIKFYGNDTMFLIGGALHALGSLVDGARKFNEIAQSYE